METKTKTQLTIKSYFEKDDIQSKFKEMLGKRATQFITSVIQISNSNDLLKNSEPSSLINAAITAATLDLPINQNLGFAYIIPFNEKQKDGSYLTKAQFQIGYRGFIQLAQRSGQFKTISATPIFDGQIISTNPLTGFEFDFSIKSEKIIGYAAYFELLNGFSKTLYLTSEQINKHGLKFSQTFKKGFGLWKDDFDAMAIKTVIKLLLSKYAPLSVEMQRAVITDQSIINNADTLDVDYIDNSTPSINEINDDKERQRLIKHINESKNAIDLKNSLGIDILEKYDLLDLYTNKIEELSDGKN
jgi:recombination protein RecT